MMNQPLPNGRNDQDDLENREDEEKNEVTRDTCESVRSENYVQDLVPDSNSNWNQCSHASLNTREAKETDNESSRHVQNRQKLE